MGFCVCHSHFWSPGCPSGESSTPAHLFRALSRVLNFVAVWKNSTVCIFNKGTAWMVNRCVVLGWLNIKGRVFVPVHRTVNHRWPDMTPGKSITAQDCIGLLSERVCAHVCVYGLSSPSPHCDKSWNWVSWCVEGLVCVCVCVCLSCGGAYGFTASCTWVNLYLVRPWLVSAPTANRGRPSAYLCETAASLARWQGLSWIHWVAPLGEKHNARERKWTGRFRGSKI